MKTPEQKARHAITEKARRARIKADPVAHAHQLALKREASKRYRQRHGAISEDGQRHRRMKSRNFTEVMKNSSRASSNFCKDCRFWNPSYCSLTCETEMPRTPMCAYGRSILNTTRTLVRIKERGRRQSTAEKTSKF